MQKYNPQKIEKKWQDEWDKSKIYKAEDFSKKKKFYCLIEFPYPSGAGLHVGHLRSHIAIDIVARKKRMSGHNVLYPIGWDAFGLPTENFAIKTKTHPKIVTENNIKNFTRQIKSYGPSFDWLREINTTDPKYYKWTQWIFLKLFNSFYDKKSDKARDIGGLDIPENLDDDEKRKYIDDHRMAYELEMAINWCPSCKIGLANEEVVNGACERCGAPAEKKMMKQWMLRITKYAERLIKDLDTVDYLEKIKTQQVNWIGKSEGATVKFTVIASKAKQSRNNTHDACSNGIVSVAHSATLHSRPRNDNILEVFTTRPDTLFGCTYMVISPEHSLIEELKSEIENLKEIEKYIEQAKNKSDLDRTDLAKEKTGVELKGIKAINPVNNEEIPIWVADYVLASYGTGAIMAVPAHDERDFEFAKKFGLEIRQVVKSEKKKLCLIIHGSPYTNRRKYLNYVPENEENWLPYIKEQLEKNGVKTYTPLMPMSWQPNYKNWKKQIEKLNLKIDENSILIGHSAGGSFLVRWLGEKQIKINKLILIAPSKLISDESIRLKDFNDFEIDKNIKNLANEIIVFSSKDDKPYRIKSHKIYKKELDAKFIEFENKGHFTFKYMKSNRFPELLKEILGEVCTENGIVINSSKFNGLTTAEFKKEITKWLAKNNLGKKAINYKLRDWVFSRQHYWGEPIPIVKCKKCGNVALEKKDLPLELPEVKNYEPTNTGESPLAKIDKWVNIKCPKCKGNAKRETDTMPNWAGSSWYYLRYVDPDNDQEFASPEKLKHWMPVDLYNGGMEHTTLHLLYSRFWHKFLYDLGYVNTSEPYKTRRSHGMILAEDGQKMSKSRGNTINPDEVIKQYGADTIRLYEMFMGPYSEAIPWSTSSLIGMNRFLEKVWNLQTKTETRSIAPESIEPLLHKTIKKVTEDIDNLKFNTAISQLMILLNKLEKEKTLFTAHYSQFLILLSPFAPHITEELWKILGNKESVHLQSFPKYNPELIKEKEITLVIQINGKLRDQIKAPADISEEDAKKLALESEKIKKWIDGKEVRKIIFIKGRLVNVVV